MSQTLKGPQDFHRATGSGVSAGGSQASEGSHWHPVRKQLILMAQVDRLPWSGTYRAE